MDDESEAFKPTELALQEPIPMLRVPKDEELCRIIEDLQSGRRVSDKRFDTIYPESIQKLSSTHWTAVRAAKRAAELLVVSDKMRVLDVGSGAGKFCLIGALTTKGIFVGIEQRKYLTQLCQNLVNRYKIDRIEFIHGNMRDIDWSNFDAFYLYNPFIENIYDDAIRIDNYLEQTRVHYEKYVRIVQMKLYLAPFGTRVVTYHGFGGDMPPYYVRKLREPMDTDAIELWVKE